jgi:hypothetical protein
LHCDKNMNNLHNGKWGAGVGQSEQARQHCPGVLGGGRNHLSFLDL